MKRVIVVGSIGAGKTTFAKAVAKKLSIRHIELDRFNWLPGWKLRLHEELKVLVAQEIGKPSWVICGNYSVLRPMTWSKADTIIWLDYSFLICFWRCFKRSFSNALQRKQCCNGNYETLGRMFFSKQSILWWVMRTYKKRRKKYIRLMQDPMYKHIQFVRLRSDSQAKSWFKAICS